MENDRAVNEFQIDFNCSSCSKIKHNSKSIPVYRIIEKLDSYFSKNDLESATSLLKYWQNEAVQLGDSSGELSIVNEQLGLYRKINDEVGAEIAISRAIELLALNNAENTISGATIMLNAATTCKAFKKLDKALILYDKASEIYNKKLEKDDPRFAALYNNYATALVDLKRYDEALQFYKTAINITEKNPETVPDCAITFVNMAHLYAEMLGTDSVEIEECLLKAEQLLDSCDKQNSYYAFVCDKCAPSFDYFGFFLTAKKLYKKAEEIYAGN